MKPLGLLLSFFLFFLLLPTTSSAYYKFYMLVLSWPVSYCRPPVACKPGILPPYFTIHGFWPSTKFPPYPQNCIGPDLQEMNVADIKPRLMNVWPSLIDGESDFSFWSREWNRHGKCGLDYFQTPFRYFKKALTLTTVMDITQKLANNNIYPDDVRMYTAEEIFKAIEESGYSKPQIECNKLTNPPELREIRFCFTPQMNSVMCPQFSLEIDCGATFKWPSQ